MLVGYSKIGYQYLFLPPACIRGPAFICRYRPRPRLLSEARPLIESRSLFADLRYPTLLSHILGLTLIHTHTHTLPCSHTYSVSLTHILTHILGLTHTHTHTHTRSRSHTYSQTYSVSLSHILTHILGLALTHILTNILRLTQTHTLYHSHSHAYSHTG